MRAKGGGVPGALDAEQFEPRADAEAHHHGWHDQARDRDVEEQGRAFEAAAEREPGQEGENDRQHHDDQAELPGAPERAPDVANRLGSEQFGKPVQRDAAHREHEATLGALEREDDDGQDRTVEEQHEQAETVAST
jgi:hypothetical protein